MKKVLLATAAAAAALAGAAHAATYSFTSGGLIGSDVGFPSKVFNDTTNTESLTAYAINTQAPPTPKLHQSDFGLGVNLGLLDSNQLDNIGDDEAIVFDLGKVMNVETLSLKLASFDDQYAIYGTNDAGVTTCSSGGLSCLTSISTFITSGSGAGPLATTNVLLSGAYRYIVATVFGGSGDGYRVAGLSVSEVPLPAGLPLMAAGLGLFGGLLRSRKRA